MTRPVSGVQGSALRRIFLGISNRSSFAGKGRTERSEAAVWSEKVRSPTCNSCLSDDAKDLFLHLGVVAELFPGALHLYLLCQGH